MAVRDWFSRPTEFKLALKRATQPAGDLSEELRRLGNYSISSAADAEALCRILSQLRTREVVIGGWRSFSSLVLLFQSIGGPDCVAFPVLKRTGVPLLISILDDALKDESHFDRDDMLFVLKILAMYGTRDGTDAVIRAARWPLKPDSYWWHVVLEFYTKDHPETGRLFRALADPLPRQFIGVSLLDCANAALIDGAECPHPFDTPAGKQQLESWLTDDDEEHFSYAVSAVAALPFVSNPDRDRLLAIAFDHPSAQVQIEAAWAGAKLGGEAAVGFLARLCLDVNYGEMAKRYLTELKRKDAIPEIAAEPDFRAKATFAEWLRHPSELGRTPDELDIVDRRELHWPPDREPKTFWLIKYRVRDTTGLADDDLGVGLVGSVTFCFFSYDLDQRPPDDCYAIHCVWEMEHRKLITGLDVEGSSSEYDHLLRDCQIEGITDGHLIEIVEIDLVLGYPRRIVALVRANRDGRAGWIVLDGSRTRWYAAADMPPDQYEKVVTKIHVGRELLGLSGDSDRRRFLRLPRPKRPPEQIVVAFEEVLREVAFTSIESQRFFRLLSLLGSSFDDYVESLVTQGHQSNAAAVAAAHESLLAAGRSAQPAVRGKWLDVYSPIGSTFDKYIDALIALKRRDEIPSLIHEFRGGWDHNYGYEKLGSAAFKGGFDEIAEPFFLLLRGSGKDWCRYEEIGLLAIIWHRQGRVEDARSLLVEAMHNLLEQSARATGGDRKRFEEWFQNHRSVFLKLLGESGENDLRELGIPASTYRQPD